MPLTLVCMPWTVSKELCDNGQAGEAEDKGNGYHDHAPDDIRYDERAAAEDE